MLFRSRIQPPLGFAPDTVDARVLSGATVAVGQIAEVDLRNAQSTNLLPGNPTGGWGTVVAPSVQGTRGGQPQVVALEVLSPSMKGYARAVGIVKVKDAAGVVTKGSLISVGDATAGRMIYGIALSATINGFFDCLWDGEDGLGQNVAVVVGGNNPPVAAITATPDHGDKSLSVTLDFSGSTDDGAITKYEIDFGEGAGFQDNLLVTSIVHVYTVAGTYDAVLRVTDNGTPALKDTASVRITVTNPNGGGTDGTAGSGGTGGGTPGTGGGIDVS